MVRHDLLRPNETIKIVFAKSFWKYKESGHIIMSRWKKQGKKC